MEPRRVRQTWPKMMTEWYMISYGFGVVKWKKAIMSVYPSLELNLNTVETVHRSLRDQMLIFLDVSKLYSSGYRFFTAILLNELYEAVCSLRPRSTLDESAINHFRSVLEHRISHLYLTIFPAPQPSKDFEELQKQANYFGAYTRTTSRLPQEYRDRALGLKDTFVLEAQNSLSYDKKRSSLRIPEFRQIISSSTSYLPELSRYIPARFLSVFGLVADVLCRGREEIGDFLFQVFESAENTLKRLCNMSIYPIILALSPHALAITMNAAFDALATRTTTITPHPNQLFCAGVITSISIEVWIRFLIYGPLHMGPGEKADMWLNSWPHISLAMYSWVEHSGFAQKLEQFFISFFTFDKVDWDILKC
jgi:hypothetical protein